MRYSTAQPIWEFVTNLGDADPLEFGGYFIYRDITGIYPEEAEKVEVSLTEEPTEWWIYRIVLDRCTYTNGVLSDNKYHPDHPVWFAKPEPPKERNSTCYLSNVASCYGDSTEQLIELLCSEDPIQRALGYEAVASYHGWENFDSYPLMFTRRREVTRRYIVKNRPIDLSVRARLLLAGWQQSINEDDDDGEFRRLIFAECLEEEGRIQEAEAIRSNVYNLNRMFRVKKEGSINV